MYCRTVQTHQQNFNISTGIYPTRCPYYIYGLCLIIDPQTTSFVFCFVAKLEVPRKWERRTRNVVKEEPKMNEKRNAVCRANVNNWRPNKNASIITLGQNLTKQRYHYNHPLSPPIVVVIRKFLSPCSVQVEKIRRQTSHHRSSSHSFIVPDSFISFSSHSKCACGYELVKITKKWANRAGNKKKE